MLDGGERIMLSSSGFDRLMVLDRKNDFEVSDFKGINAESVKQLLGYEIRCLAEKKIDNF